MLVHLAPFTDMSFAEAAKHLATFEGGQRVASSHGMDSDRLSANFRAAHSFTGVEVGVIRRNVDSLDGVVSIRSEPGKGTSVRRCLPVKAVTRSSGRGARAGADASEIESFDTRSVRRAR